MTKKPIVWVKEFVVDSISIEIDVFVFVISLASEKHNS